MYKILWVHDVYIWFASGRISTFTASPALSQGTWQRRLVSGSHVCSRGPCDLAKDLNAERLMLGITSVLNGMLSQTVTERDTYL